MGVPFKLGCAASMLLCASAALILSQPALARRKAPEPPKDSQRLQEQNRLLILRYVDGEFAKTVVPLPRGKKGLEVRVGKPLNSEKLQYELRSEGVAANAGDRVQITKLAFEGHKIVLQINGGGKKPFHLWQHLQIGMGPDVGPPPVADNPNEGLGSTIVLDFGKPLPNVTADEVKQDLAPVLDFSSRSSAVNWIDTLPPEIQQAIKNHQAVVGMDQDMVIAALGRPDKKVRSRDPNSGNELEDWIYGSPPARTTFVTFSGEKVIRVKVFE